MMMVPTPKVASTITGANTLGRMWRKMMRQSLAPIASAATTNSCFFKLST